MKFSRPIVISPVVLLARDRRSTIPETCLGRETLPTAHSIPRPSGEETRADGRPRPLRGACWTATYTTPWYHVTCDDPERDRLVWRSFAWHPRRVSCAPQAACHRQGRTIPARPTRKEQARQGGRCRLAGISRAWKDGLPMWLVRHSASKTASVSSGSKLGPPQHRDTHFLLLLARIACVACSVHLYAATPCRFRRHCFQHIFSRPPFPQGEERDLRLLPAVDLSSSAFGRCGTSAWTSNW